MLFTKKENDRYYNTKAAVFDQLRKVTFIGEYYTDKESDGHICAYCGKQQKRYANGRTGIIFYNCDCEDAEKEHEINVKIEELKRQLPKENLCLTRQITAIKKEI